MILCTTFHGSPPYRSLIGKRNSARWPHLIEAFEWTPTDAENADDESELTDAQLAQQGLFRLIPSLAERAGEKPWAVVDYGTFCRVLEKVYPRPRTKKKKK